MFSGGVEGDKRHEMGCKISYIVGTSIVATTTFPTQTFARDFSPKFKDTLLHD